MNQIIAVLRMYCTVCGQHLKALPKAAFFFFSFLDYCYIYFIKIAATRYCTVGWKKRGLEINKISKKVRNRDESYNPASILIRFEKQRCFWYIIVRFKRNYLGISDLFFEFSQLCPRCQNERLAAVWSVGSEDISVLYFYFFIYFFNHPWHRCGDELGKSQPADFPTV